MTVELLHYTPLEIAVKAIRTCYDSKGDNLGEKDMKLLRGIISNSHFSTIEHLYYSFSIDGISRACLQEIVRHRIASYSIKSTRYTLRELIKEQPFITFEDLERAKKYLVFTGNENVDLGSVHLLERIRCELSSGVKNDIAKYCLPESYKTSLVWTINARSLRNFLDLRLSPRALKEIRELASNVILALPNEHKILFEDIINKYEREVIG